MDTEEGLGAGAVVTVAMPGGEAILEIGAEKRWSQFHVGGDVVCDDVALGDLLAQAIANARGDSGCPQCGAPWGSSDHARAVMIGECEHQAPPLPAVTVRVSAR